MNNIKRNTRIGWVISILTSLMLLLDGVMKLIQPIEVIEATTDLGYSESSIATIGTILIICTILYLIPKTSVWEVILLTGYLGGAVAIHFRVASPLFSHQLFPIYIGIFIWLGIILRYPVLRHFIFNPKAYKNGSITTDN